MGDSQKLSPPEQWAHLRFSVVGPVLAAPPAHGDLATQLRELAEREWVHPLTGERVRFKYSTLERWYYIAKNAMDPVAGLRRRVRKDAGTRPSLREKVRELLRHQYREHPSWSYQLHADNLKAAVALDPQLGAAPGYATVWRYMQETGLLRQPRRRRNSEGERKAQARLEEREVRSYEMEHPNALWHSDFHVGSRRVLLPTGVWAVAVLLAILDDYSRLCCHAQWYLAESAENYAHGLCQGFQKRGLPRMSLSDNGSAMTAGETVQGLQRLGVIAETTLTRSPYQNGKQESFWGQVEGRLMAMLEGEKELTLELLNQATQSWVEMEYNRAKHSETGQPPLERYLSGHDLGRPCPSSEALRQAFGLQQTRSQRTSDGTVSIEGRRFEVPSRFRTLRRVTVRYARWDLSRAYLINDRAGEIIGTLYPLNKQANADGRRRRIGAIPVAPRVSEPVASGIAPLLRKLMAEYSATGLPPAYVPKEEKLPPPAAVSATHEDSKESADEE